MLACRVSSVPSRPSCGSEREWDFDSPDHVPVDLVFGLLVPEESTDEHLEILAAIARVFSDERVQSSIRSAEEPARIREVLIRNGIFT